MAEMAALTRLGVLCVDLAWPGLISFVLALTITGQPVQFQIWLLKYSFGEEKWRSS